jgi:CheY-like chemotaxis protein
MRNHAVAHDLEQLAIEGGALHYADARHPWTIPLGDIALIGEYTTPSGPADEDYFIVFVDRTGGRYEAPAAAAADQVMDALRERLGEFGFHLMGSVDLASRIMWPAAYAGAPLYEFARVQPHGIGDRVRRIFGSYALQTEFSEPARRALAEQQRAGAGDVRGRETSVEMHGFWERIATLLPAWLSNLTRNRGGNRATTTLLPESDQQVIDLIIELLRHHDWAVGLSESQAETIQRISQHTYDLLVLALTTQGHDVLQYLEQAKEKKPHGVARQETPLRDDQKRIVDDVLRKVSLEMERLRELDHEESSAFEPPVVRHG